MATPPPLSAPVSPDTLITIKVNVDGINRRFKLPLHELGAQVLLPKLRSLLDVAKENEIIFERYSDSAGSFVTLDSQNPAVFKQLYRAAKAKLKLRLRATIVKAENQAVKFEIAAEPKTVKDEKPLENRTSYLDTVLSRPPPPPLSTTIVLPILPPKATQLPISSTSDLKEQKPECVKQDLYPKFTPAAECNFHPFHTMGRHFTISCNHCNDVIPNMHYHCGICDQGDFDLCLNCADQGVSCDGEDHWLIKRFIRNGAVVPSVTSTLPAKKSVEKAVETLEPVKSEHLIIEKELHSRTCNGCIRDLPAHEFLTCKNCPDFDLCYMCFEHSEHGHHPGHMFAPVEIRDRKIEPAVHDMCKPGRNHHHEALCDGCEQRIIGVRHKCLSCPDWDFCDSCISTAEKTHSGHRFAKLYDSLSSLVGTKEIHRGIYCDGPLCTARSRKTYIRGDRYKCAVCHDTDFCANCEAHPNNRHNRTHPLIKMKTPIRNVTISTVNELDNGQSFPSGDRPQARHASTETVSPPLANAATQVQTVAEVAPAENTSSVKAVVEQKIGSDVKDLDAHFESESTPDGSTFAPNHLVLQCWTLRNPGPRAWPAGCAVHYIGGDDMRNLDVKHVSSAEALTSINRSNVLKHGLEAGQTANFSVILKSPVREGRAISYWRLKTADGIPFGHKLWVDITVKAAPVELPLHPVAPVSIPITDGTEAKSEDKELRSQESSTMIFPKLEKESPVSSVHNVAETITTTAEKESVAGDEQDMLEDVESVEFEEAESDNEEAFMTDDEYDILDASDEDLPDAASISQKK